MCIYQHINAGKNNDYITRLTKNVTSKPKCYDLSNILVRVGREETAATRPYMARAAKLWYVMLPMKSEPTPTRAPDNEFRPSLIRDTSLLNFSGRGRGFLFHR